MASEATPISEFALATKKAWGRQIELCVYDPSTNPDGMGNPSLSLSSNEVLGLKVDALHVDFKVKRSRTFAENTAEFKVYNANPDHRLQLTAPGMRVRFAAGYQDQGGVLGLFWGSTTAGANSVKNGVDWVTTIPCIASVSEAMGTEYVTVAAKNAKSTQAKQDIQTRQINRIPVSFGYAPGHPIRQVLWNIQAITGLAVYGAEALPDAVLKNGFNYVGGVRGAIDQFKKTCLIPIGWTLFIDNNSLVVYPVDESMAYTVTSAYLTTKGFTKLGKTAEFNTGYISHTDKTKSNIPPKMAKGKDGKMHRVPVPRTYEVKCLLNPKIAPNTLVTIEVPGLDTTLLVDSVEFEGNNYGGGFTTTFEGHVYDGVGK